jgi:hypothetical protein
MTGGESLQCQMVRVGVSQCPTGGGLTIMAPRIPLHSNNSLICTLVGLQFSQAKNFEIAFCSKCLVKDTCLGLSPNLNGGNRHKAATIHLFWVPCAKEKPMVILVCEQCQQILTF